MKYGLDLASAGVAGDPHTMGELAHIAEESGWDRRKRIFLSLISALAALLLAACNSVWQTPAPIQTLSAASQTPGAPVCSTLPLDTTLPVPAEPQNYIGLHFAALPAGFESHVSFVLDGPGTDYIVRQVIRDRGEMLWLERTLCHDENGYPYTEIGAALGLPGRQEKERFITGTCRENGVATPMVSAKSEFDYEIVAIGEFDDFSSPPVSINYAWRANPRTESFEALLPDSVTCAGIRGL